MFKEIKYKGEIYIEDISTKNKIKRSFQFYNEELDGFKTLSKEQIIKELIKQRISNNKNCVDCFDIENCNNCFNSRDLINCNNCEMSVALYNCNNCKTCMGLENKSDLENEDSFF